MTFLCILKIHLLIDFAAFYHSRVPSPCPKINVFDRNNPIACEGLEV
jgi:hypothetical protein